MSQPTVYAQKIFYFENAVKDPQGILEKIETTNKDLKASDLIGPWHDWTSSNADHQFGYRKSTNPSALSTSTKSLINIYLNLLNPLDFAAEYYARQLGIPVGERAPISISKYLPEKHMGPHVDDGNINAHISAVLYLNDNFLGGELNFPNQDVSIKPKAGSIILFPSKLPYLHDPRPASGVKYIAPAFWFLNNQ